MNIYVKKSKIHGFGLFAGSDIKKGETILDWSNCVEILTEVEVESLSVSEQKYISVINGQFILFKPPARFINHSCNPNTLGAEGRDFALRDIRKGEEITVNYLTEKVPKLDIKCHCGSSNCHKFLRNF